MPENAVKHHVKISPVHKYPVLPVKPAKLCRMKIHHSPVCSKWTDRTIHLVSKAAQRHIQKTHAHIQLVSCCPEDAAADVLETLGCFLGIGFLAWQEIIFIVFSCFCFYFTQDFHLL